MAPFVADDRLKDFITESDELVPQVGQVCSSSRIVPTRRCAIASFAPCTPPGELAASPLLRNWSGSLVTPGTFSISCARASSPSPAPAMTFTSRSPSKHSSVRSPRSSSRSAPCFATAPYVAGATITGDGRVRLVLDPNHSDPWLFCAIRGSLEDIYEYQYSRAWQRGHQSDRPIRSAISSTGSPESFTPITASHFWRTAAAAA